ncbi:rhamnogalacturonan acetylesterase [Telluribacter sp. SYSU D00476]|uniref:rhamnogalacturonan acetylesterase n=1 Tax=Telluribacter sp. SYSU D00476 TaxID=2811430 RepID=UPI001FF34D04|nr:rhamnogalacturonan acetylesterase [Telluribacter sp. SYSU D00476]
MKNILLLALLLFCSGWVASAQTTTYRFDFGSGKVGKDYLAVGAATLYTAERGYGITPAGTRLVSGTSTARGALKSDFVTSGGPFFFTVDLPEGNYDVKLLLGGGKEGSETTVKVENRRLMLEKVVTQPGQVVEQTFTVNVRTPQINATERVSLKPREQAYLHWDRQLTFEFNGSQPTICALEITPNTGAAMVFLAGNSTVVDQAEEPWAAWGQMLPRFFKPGEVAIANHAESGESLRSFLAAKRLDKIMSQMRPGDYLFIEFAHNDQKQKDLEPFVGYKDLLRNFITATREKGGIPVLVTSMHRRNFSSTGHINNTLGDFPEAVRQTAREENVTLIDLNAMSKTLWEALGVEGSKKAFVHFPAGTYPNQNKALEDNTHFTNYGAYQLARCVVEGIKQSGIELSKHLLPGIPAYDPAQPVPFDQFQLSASPLVQVVKPDGN